MNSFTIQYRIHGILILNKAREVNGFLQTNEWLYTIRASTFQGGSVAQLVEQRIENPRVGGSIPSLATIQIRREKLIAEI